MKDTVFKKPSLACSYSLAGDVIYDKEKKLVNIRTLKSLQDSTHLISNMEENKRYNL